MSRKRKAKINWQEPCSKRRELLNEEMSSFLNRELLNEEINSFLNEELLHTILLYSFDDACHYLNIALVCKRWSVVLKDYKFWVQWLRVHGISTLGFKFLYKKLELIPAVQCVTQNYERGLDYLHLITSDRCYMGRYTQDGGFSGPCVELDSDRSRVFYKGEMKGGEYNGHGKLYNKVSGKLQYVGKFEYGRAHGFGLEYHKTYTMIITGKYHAGDRNGTFVIYPLRNGKRHDIDIDNIVIINSFNNKKSALQATQTYLDNGVVIYRNLKLYDNTTIEAADGPYKILYKNGDYVTGEIKNGRPEGSYFRRLDLNEAPYIFGSNSPFESMLSDLQ